MGRRFVDGLNPISISTPDSRALGSVPTPPALRVDDHAQVTLSVTNHAARLALFVHQPALEVTT
jgi:hypothetical protein